ncbi:T9SS C-terminal target domain-containing protein [Runella sp. SP2]|nr:T9SS C-terminal target domain-containing protein [Runella sp. SP2]
MPFETGASYQWFRGNTLISNLNSIAVANVGTYKAVVTSQYGCSNSNTLAVTARAKIEAVATHNITTAQGIVTLKLTANPAGMRYNWSGPANFSSTQRNPSISPISTQNQGIYTLNVLEVATGCTASTTTSVTISNNARLALSEEYFSEETNGGRLIISPNPTIDRIQVKLKLSKNTPYEVYLVDLLGQSKKLESSIIQDDNERLTFDISDYPIGVYFLRVVLPNNEEVLSQKILKINR